MLAVIGSYLFGGIPIGLLVGRARGIDDIRQYGSGNIGASNVLRVIGVKAGLFVWLMDALKGFVPVLVTRHVFAPAAGPVAQGATPTVSAEWWIGAVAVAAIVGHCFSVYLRFTGGRGVSTSLGVLIGLDWRVGLICFACWIAVVAVTRYISLGSMVACALSVALLRLFSAPFPFMWAAGATALLVILRHHPNIRRLLSGTERRIGQKEPPGTDTETAS